jgi:O-antigen ligase
MRLLVATVVCVAMFGLIIFSSAEDRQSVAESVQDNAMSYAERGHDVLRTLEGRMEGWKIGLRMFGDAPILGHGYDAGVRYKGGQYGFGNLSHMHNSHFQVLVNSGIVGYAIWLIMFIVPLFLVFRSFGGAFFGRTVVERYSVELFVIMLLIFLRSITGQILVTHQWSLMIFMGAYLHLKLGRVATPLIPVRPGKAGRPAARWPRRTSSVNQVRYSRHEP